MMSVIRSVWLVGPAVLVLAATVHAQPVASVAEAAKVADWDTVRALVADGADVTVAQGDGTTALHWAGYWDAGDIATLLLDAGAGVSMTNDLGVTPLWTACENGGAAMTRLLLAAGADPNVALPSGETLLMTAVRTGNVTVVRRLLAAGADVNSAEQGRSQTALMWAVAQRHADVVEVLLEYGPDLEARSDIRTEVARRRPSRGTPITSSICPREATRHYCSRRGSATSRRRGYSWRRVPTSTTPPPTAPAPPSWRLTAGMAPWRRSSSNGVPTRMRLGPVTPRCTQRSCTKMKRWSPSCWHMVLTRMPWSSDRRPCAATASTTTCTRPTLARHRSGAGGAVQRAAIMRLLAEHGADPLVAHRPVYWEGSLAERDDRAQVHEGVTTAVMAAAGLGGRAPLFAVDRLARIAESAPVRSTRRDPDPVVREATTLEAVRVAVELGVDVNVANATGETALHAVAARGYDTVIAYLVEQGARLDLTNRDNQTPLDAARARRAGESTVALLQRLGAAE